MKTIFFELRGDAVLLWWMLLLSMLLLSMFGVAIYFFFLIFSVLSFLFFFLISIFPNCYIFFYLSCLSTLLISSSSLSQEICLSLEAGDISLTLSLLWYNDKVDQNSAVSNDEHISDAGPYFNLTVLWIVFSWVRQFYIM